MNEAVRSIALVSTGGTIEKTYDELQGVLTNHLSVLDVMLSTIFHEGTKIERVALMNKDSLDMTEADHALIAETAERLARDHDGVIVVHGTDSLCVSGDTCVERFGRPATPIVFTGAMRPYAMRTSDAAQNLTEALLAVQLLPPGVYVAMHGKVLEFPGVIKDRDRGTFVRG